MKVFLVEDSEVIREHLREMLSEIAGMHVVGDASTEREATAAIEAARPDLVILDLTLAQGSGLGVLQHTKAAVPQTKVVVLTNRVAPQYRARCLAMGAEYFFDKTRDFESLRGLVKRFHPGGA